MRGRPTENGLFIKSTDTKIVKKWRRHIVAIPKYHEFMKPLLLLLSDNTTHIRTDIYRKTGNPISIDR